MWKLIGITAGVIPWTLFIIFTPCSGQTPETAGIQFGYENYCSELDAGERIRVTIPVQQDSNLEGNSVEEEVGIPAHSGQRFRLIPDNHSG